MESWGRRGVNVGSTYDEAAADDAGAVLSVLARMDAEARKTIEGSSRDGPGLLRHLLEREETLESPKGSAEAAGGHYLASSAGGGGGDSSTPLATSPPPGQSAIRRCISGDTVSIAFERLESK